MTQLSSIGQRATNMSNNIMKNDYIELKKFGFEDLDISTNE